MSETASPGGSGEPEPGVPGERIADYRPEQDAEEIPAKCPECGAAIKREERRGVVFVSRPAELCGQGWRFRVVFATTFPVEGLTRRTCRVSYAAMSRRHATYVTLDRALIRARRAELGLTQEDLARAVGVTLRTAVRWEQGDNLPNGWQLLELARVLGVEPRDLYLAQPAAA